VWNRVAIRFASVAAMAGCAPSDDATTSTTAVTPSSAVVAVAAASDLRFALEELAGAFTRTHADVQVKVTFGASGNLVSQISNGAPFDLFLSADLALAQKLIESGLGVKGSEFTYAVGHLAVWTPKGSTLDPGSSGLETLTRPAVRRIAIANPAHAPYGRAAVEALKTAGIYDRVRDRLVFGENVAEAAHFVESGVADVGVIASSLGHSPVMREQGTSWEIPGTVYPGLRQGGVILQRGKDSLATTRFREFLLGVDGRAILSRHGFELPDG
jgi:molybdate transport system substrate-binding protein